MSNKRLVPLIIVLLAGLNVYAQTPNAVPYNFLNNMVQPAPNAAALGKYADYPVSYYTGVPDISVPLYTLKDGGISLPISLSYHASGIKVSELATWVGLGWVLNANGMIVRTVMGAPDEGTHESPAMNATGPRGYYRDHGLSSLPLVPYPLADGTSSDAGNTFEKFEVPAIGNAQLDCEPDIFTFNFNGHAGKFLFDENRQPQLLEDDNLKIIPGYDQNNGGGFLSFTIITSDGVKYIFGENNMYETTNPSSTQSGIDFNSVAPSSWVLTHVINPNTKDTVTFSYTPETYTYRDLGSESNLYLTNASTSFSTTNQAYALQYGCDLSNIFRNYLTTTVNGLRLTSIQSKNFTIKFLANNVRTDLVQGSTAYSLDSVKVYNNASICIRQFALNHNYFVSTPNTNSYVTGYLNQYGDTSDRYRLKLLSVTEYSGDGLTAKPPYVFSYYQATQLPRRMSYDQDHWGFCNNWNGDYNPYFTPTVTAGICGSDVTPGANRTAAFPAMEGFTLTSIQDPLGAVTNFTYEANTATNIYPAGTLVGGLRVNQITVTDNVTGKVKTRKYNYNSSGQLFHMPVYLTTLYNEFYKAQTMGQSGYGYIGYSQATSFWGMLRQSQSVVPLQDLQGGHIGYGMVTETFGANGEGGSIIRRYKVVVNGTDSLSSRLDITAYTQSAQMYGYVGIYGNGHFNDTSAYPAVKPQNLHYYNGYSSTNYASFDNTSFASSNYYPLAPLQPDFQRGKLLAEETYDASGHKIDSTAYTYSHNYHEDRMIRGLKAYESAVPPPSGCGGCQSTIYYALTFYKIHTGISHLTTTVKKTYNGSNYVTETTNYNYESPYHTLKTSETATSSQGDTYTNRTYYSWDYANSATTDNIFGKMKARNVLAPVNSSNWKNGNLVDAKITQYKDFAGSAPDTLIYPGSIYATETVNPLTPTQANQTTNWGGLQSGLIPNTTYYKTKATFGYDSYYGKLTTQQLTGNINHAVAWDNQISLPIAVVDNAYNQSHTIIVSNSSTASVTLPSTGGTTHYTASFTVTATGPATVSIGFSGNPNYSGNPSAIVSCTISGTTASGANYNSGTLLLCISAGTATCSYPSSTTLSSIAPGQYVLTAYYANTPTLFCNVYASVSYPLPSSYSTTGPQQFYYQGFEQSLVTNASQGVTNIGTAHTGNNFWNGAYTVNFTPPSDGRTYKITYWYLNNGVWTLMPEQTYTGTGMSLTGGTAYDDVRVFPSDAQMTTYTYDSTGNITSSTDAKGLTTFYEYDSMQRLVNVRDKDKNIVKHVDYHYQGQ
jgi:YD repeat-containing protein